MSVPTPSNWSFRNVGHWGLSGRKDRYGDYFSSFSSLSGSGIRKYSSIDDIAGGRGLGSLHAIREPIDETATTSVIFSLQVLTVSETCWKT